MEHIKNQKQIISAIVVAAFIIAAALLLKDSKPPRQNDDNLIIDNTTLPSAENRAVGIDEHIVGNPNAQIIILEYSDLECPFCKTFHGTMHQIVENSNGKVAWVYRHYPLEFHTKAFAEAEAAECAWDQGGNDAFWEYVDRIFEITPSNNGLDTAKLSETAEYIGLDVGAFKTCLASGKFKAKVDADIDAGEKDGVSGTPHSIILKNGKVVDTINGAEPYTAVVKKLNAASR